MTAESETKYCVLRGPYGNVFWSIDTGKYWYHDQNTGESGFYTVLGKGLTKKEAMDMCLFGSNMGVV